MGGAPASPEELVRSVSGDGAENDFDKLLQQLRKEPSNDVELAAKFGLYETYGEQVEKMRKMLFELHEENKETLPDAVKKDFEKQLTEIDSAEMMGIPDGAHGWFVYHMLKQAGKNNDSMGHIMGNFEKRLEFLATNDQD